MKDSFFGRQEQIADLERLWGKRTSSFVTCRGRRRIGKSTITSVAPYRRAGARNGTRCGLQVDLLLQTRRTAYLIEVKRKHEIGREVIGEMEEKVRLLPKRSGVSVRTALVYEGHLAPIVEAEGYFDAIIPFRRLLGI